MSILPHKYIQCHSGCTSSSIKLVHGRTYLAFPRWVTLRCVCDHGLQLFLKLPEIVSQLLLVVIHVLSYQLFVLIESFLTSETKRSEVD